MTKIISDIIVLLISILKYPFVMAGIIFSGKGDWQSILSNILGGLIGIFLFTFGGALLETLYVKFFPTKKGGKKERFLHFIRDRFGVWGIAFASIILTVPGSILLCLTITSNKWEVIMKMIVALTAWTVFLNLIHLI